MKTRFCVALAALSGALLAGLAQPAAAAPLRALDLDFTAGPQVYVGVVPDASGSNRDGAVLATNGGALTPYPDPVMGTAARFPGPCPVTDCPAAVVRVADAPVLNPGLQPFSFGARLKLRFDQTSVGSNIVQKGFYGDPGGQWKLQVDGLAGRPSCVVAGQRDGGLHRAKALADMSVADGAWHTLTCVRTPTAVQVLVDGELKGQAEAMPVRVENSAPVMVGGKGLSANNDQFHGALASVVVNVG